MIKETKSPCEPCYYCKGWDCHKSPPVLIKQKGFLSEFGLQEPEWGYPPAWNRCESFRGIPVAETTEFIPTKEDRLPD